MGSRADRVALLKGLQCDRSVMREFISKRLHEHSKHCEYCCRSRDYRDESIIGVAGRCDA